MQKKREEKIKAKSRSVKALIPAAGLGKRFHPLSLVLPKELFPMNRKPLIQWAVEEVLASHIRDIGIVIRKGKEIIKNYFEALRTSSDPAFQGIGKKLGKIGLHYIFQDKPLGLGNAIYEARGFLDDSPFLMVIPDQFMISQTPATLQLLEAAREDFAAVWSSVVRVSGQERAFFPGAREFALKHRNEKIWEVVGFQEGANDESRDIRVGFGRTFFPSGTLRFFHKDFLNPATGEVDLLLTFEALFKSYKNYALELDGTPVDLGTWAGYERFFWTATHVGSPLNR
jgi:UTP--glucose-1-phosphate uridylyltransferase